MCSMYDDPSYRHPSEDDPALDRRITSGDFEHVASVIARLGAVFSAAVRHEDAARATGIRWWANAERTRRYELMLERSRGSGEATAYVMQAIERYTPGSTFKGQERYR